MSPLSDSSDEQAYFYYYKGKCARQEGKQNKAISNYQKAIKLKPAENQFVLALIQMYFETEEFDKALKAINKYKNSFSEDHDNFILNFIQGLAFSCNGDHRFAYQKFKRAEKLSKNLTDLDSTLLSHLYNNIACQKILFQPIEWSPHLEDEPHLSISDYVFPEAWAYYSQALIYNPENEVAKMNREFINDFCECDKMDQEVIADYTLHVKPGKPNGILTEPIIGNRPAVFGLKYLPDKISQVLKILNEYDDMVFLLDISGSMEEEMSINNLQTTRFDVVKDISKYLVSSLWSEIPIGLITVGADCESVPELNLKAEHYSRQRLIYEIDKLQTNGSTPLNDRLNYCRNLFSDSTNKKALVLFTDGLNTCGEGNTCEIAEELYNQGINVYILSFLLEFESTMEYSVYDCIANISEGQLFEVEATHGIANKTIPFDPPFYSLVLPEQQFDTSYCLNHARIKCSLPCNPVIQRTE